MDALERIGKIEDKILEILVAEGIANSVFIGEKVRVSDIKTPVVWVFPMPSTITDESLSLSEYWRLKYMIAGVVKNEDTVEGKKQAMGLTMKASKRLLMDDQGEEDRTLGGLCGDMVRTNWHPVYSRGSAGEFLYGAGVEMEIRFQTEEG